MPGFGLKKKDLPIAALGLLGALGIAYYYYTYGHSPSPSPSPTPNGVTIVGSTGNFSLTVSPDDTGFRGFHPTFTVNTLHPGIVITQVQMNTGMGVQAHFISEGVYDFTYSTQGVYHANLDVSGYIPVTDPITHITTNNPVHDNIPVDITVL